MKAIGVVKVFDLRSDTEIAKWKSPIPEIDGVEVVRAPVFKVEDYSPEMMAKYVNVCPPLSLYRFVAGLASLS